MHPSRYRTRLLLNISRAFAVPSLLLYLLVSLARLHLGSWTIPAHLLFAILYAIARNTYVDIVQAREAKQLGAKPIPRLVGRWPGNVDILFRMMRDFKTSYILDVYLRLFEEYQCTTLNTRILWVDHIITMDQEHIKFVLSTGFHHFWRGKGQKERMETFLGEGIFNRDDEKWKMHRSTARPFFARERIIDFEIFERQSTRTLAILDRLASTGAPCEAQDLFARFTLDSASEFLFGRNLDTLGAALPAPGCEACKGAKGSATHDAWGAFAQAFESAQQIITTRSRLGCIWPLVELLGDRTAPHARAIRTWLDPLVAAAVEDKRRTHAAGVKCAVEEKTFLQHLADSTDDTVLIRDELLSILLASRDTTACLLTFVTYFMAIHPDVARKLRAEVLEHCGPDGAPTYERIRRLSYMRAVISETLRLFPPVPLNVRESRTAPCALPPGDGSFTCNDWREAPLYMPGGTTVMILPLLTQRNQALWGVDADVFDPARWLDPARGAPPGAYAPFSVGPRTCIGQNYAYNEASFLLVRLLQRYSVFELAPECQPPGTRPPEAWHGGKGRQAVEQVWPGAALTLFVKGGMWVRFGRTEEAGPC